MKKYLCLLLVLLLALPLSAQAEIVCVCSRSRCACFLQERDEGPAVAQIIRLLGKQGYLTLTETQRNALSGTIDKEVASAICTFQEAMQLEATGLLDDSTLTLLIWGLTPDALTAAQSGLQPQAVWLPVNGGEKYHCDENCCDMLHPRMISLRNAEALELDPCDLCIKLE